MDIVQSAWTPWTLSRVCPDCPLNPWTLSSLAGLTGLCPWIHWTLSRVAMDIIQTVHWVHGKCPLSPWTMSRESTESMDFLQTGIAKTTKTTHISWTCNYSNMLIKLQAMQDAPPLQLYPASDKFLMWNQRKAALAFFFQTLMKKCLS